MNTRQPGKMMIVIGVIGVIDLAVGVAVDRFGGR